MIDDDLYGAFMLAEWSRRFSTCEAWRGVLLRGVEPPAPAVQRRRELHSSYAGRSDLAEFEQRLTGVYPDIDTVQGEMIGLAGFPAVAPDSHPSTIFLGKNANSSHALDRFLEACGGRTPWVCVYVMQILKWPWIERTGGQIVNCHSAVLPFARGLNSIECVAAQRDVERFRDSAGNTVHYVDQGVDTGAIIRAERIVDPLRFASIWQLKAYSYLMGRRLYADTVRDIVTRAGCRPAGIRPDPALKGPNFRGRDFTPEVRRKSEEGYIFMKSHQECSQDRGPSRRL